MKTFRNFLIENYSGFDLNSIDGEVGGNISLTDILDEIIREEANISDEDDGIGPYDAAGATGYDSRPYQIAELPRDRFVIDITKALTPSGKQVFDVQESIFWEKFYRRHTDVGSPDDSVGMTEEEISNKWDSMFDDSLSIEPFGKIIKSTEIVNLEGKDGENIDQFGANVLFLTKFDNKLLAGVQVYSIK
jgi:hypothetical protein